MRQQSSLPQQHFYLILWLLMLQSLDATTLVSLYDTLQLAPKLSSVKYSSGFYFDKLKSFGVTGCGNSVKVDYLFIKPFMCTIYQKRCILGRLLFSSLVWSFIGKASSQIFGAFMHKHMQFGRFLHLSAPYVCILVTHCRSRGSTLKHTPPELIIKREYK